MNKETKYREIGMEARVPYQEPIELMSPYDGMDEPWSLEKIEELEAVLDIYESDPTPEAG